MSEEKLRLTPSLSQRIFRGLTGRGGDVSGKGSGNIADKLLAAYGPGPRGGRVNVKAAAKSLKVTPRTVQRWISGETRAPKPDHMKAINKRARQSASTKAGRRAALAGGRGDRASKYGATAVLRGRMGPRDYERAGRSANYPMTPEMVEQMRDAYEAGGDKAAMEWLMDKMSDPTPGVGYLDDFNVVSLDEFRIDPR